ncbi:MAG TPA: hypothetical protein VJL38_00785 [Patescibacteria group bacterium]|nr:hypothetical protein [Patescibacteria group bacterium]
MMLVKHNLLHFTASHMHAARTFFHNAIVHWLLIGTFFLNIALWCFVAYFIRPGKIPIILHYNVYFGVDLVGAWWHAYALPVMSIVFILINMFVALWLYQWKERIASYILLLATLLLQMSALIACASIILINY